VQTLDHADEVARLQACINDLASLLALPAIWRGRDPPLIAKTLVEALLSCMQLDLVYVRLGEARGAHTFESVHVARDGSTREEEAVEAVRRLLTSDVALGDPQSLSIGGETLSVVPLHLGFDGSIDVLVVGARRLTFPEQSESLLLSAATTQAAIALYEASFRVRQRALAGELDQRVAQRTHELATANEDLKREVAERRLIEERLRWEERELKQSEARKAAILDSAIDGIVSINELGCIVEFNPAAEKMFGHRRADVMGMPLGDVIVPYSLRRRHQEGFSRFLETGEARVLGELIELTGLRADGHEFPVEIAITRIATEGPPAFTGFLRDISERRRAEENLRQTAAFLSEAQRLSMTGSFSWVPRSGHITWSSQLYRIFGFEESTTITLDRIGSRLHPDDAALFGEMAERAIVASGDMEFAHRIVMPDGSIKHLHLVAHGARNRAGEIEYIGAVQDVTERHQSAEALNRARSELTHVARVTTLGVLTASIAHEVNQPLSGIITNASTCLRMLAADPPNVEGARETALRTIRDGNRAADVVTRLRALFGAKSAASEGVDLNEATREVLALSSSELRRKGIIVRTDLAPTLPHIFGDRVQLQQVVLNLLLNAADAMSEIPDRPRELTVVTCEHEQNGVCVIVRDVGVGVADHFKDKLFEPFQTTKRGGMGIGLSISRSIIESHKGRIWATDNEGPGASFCFTIPTRVVPAPAP
jgi:PAS domain S-box-containing protein